ncbi:hypothetical protein [Chelativorans sp. Marseille-P2723]|uniref:hypothetical protein n=1 Tax=Chelativorans sp. Marseille-P2723 TaxID=2709133 RepID=UPI00156DC31F|nr:hypothetical protein [Chelativorans sp. Marseille-P2723]
MHRVLITDKAFIRLMLHCNAHAVTMRGGANRNKPTCDWHSLLCENDPPRPMLWRRLPATLQARLPTAAKDLPPMSVNKHGGEAEGAHVAATTDRYGSQLFDDQTSTLQHKMVCFAQGSCMTDDPEDRNIIPFAVFHNERQRQPSASHADRRADPNRHWRNLSDGVV